MRVADQYPSTFDHSINGNVLEMLQASRDRVDECWTAYAYIMTGFTSRFGAVCAMGAVMHADLDGVPHPPIEEWLEQRASDTAKEAIRLLNEAAVALYPGSPHGEWYNPIEWVNQERQDDPNEGPLGQNDPRKARVLECYDYAIRGLQEAQEAQAPAEARELAYA